VISLYWIIVRQDPWKELTLLDVQVRGYTMLIQATLSKPEKRRKFGIANGPHGI
jgi:hypothetical protein